MILKEEIKIHNNLQLSTLESEMTVFAPNVFRSII